MTGRAFLQQVISFVDRHELLKKNEVVVVGCSGGADSVALAQVLRRMMPRYGIAVHLAHLNHRLRGRASDQDQRWVEQLALQWKCPVHVEAVEVARLRKAGESLEEVARESRYRFFSEVAQRVGAAAVAVAHHRDDQAETVLMRLLRGAGLEGLAGMSPRSSLPVGPSPSAVRHPPVKLIRPLLDISKREILQFVKSEKLAFRHDVSNQSRDFLRNRIRLEVLPYLETIQPGVTRQLVQLADLAREEEAYMEGQVQKAALQWKRAGDGWKISIAGFQRVPLAIQRRLIRRGMALACGDTRGLSFQHVEAVRRACRDRVPRTVELPQGKRAASRRGWLILSPS